MVEKALPVTPETEFSYELNRILVVDDDDDMRLFVSTILASTWEEAEVVEFDPAEELLVEYLPWSHYDLLVLDYRLGEHSELKTGLDWLREYHRSPGFPPAILITGYGNDEVFAQARSLGAAGHVEKGDEFAHRLVETVHRVMGQDVPESQSDASEQERPEGENPHSAHPVIETAEDDRQAAHIPNIALSEADLDGSQGTHASTGLPLKPPRGGFSDMAIDLDLSPDLGISEQDILDLGLAGAAEPELAQRQTVGHVGGLFVFQIDQAATLLAPDRLEEVRQGLRKSLRDWVDEEGARIVTIAWSAEQLLVYIKGLWGSLHAESVAERLCHRVPREGLALGHAHIHITVSVGVSLNDSHRDVDADRLFEYANRACKQADSAGGNRVEMISLAEQDDASAEAQQDHQEGDAHVSEIDLREMIRSGTLSVQFQPLLSGDDQKAAPDFQAAPRILMDSEAEMSAASQAALLTRINQSSDLDRLAVFQAMKLLHSDGTHSESRVILDVSSCTAKDEDFWAWLTRSCSRFGQRSRLVFSFSIRDLLRQKIALAAIRKAVNDCGIALALRGQPAILTPQTVPTNLPIQLLLVDMSGEFSIQRCEQTVRLGTYARRKGIDFYARYIDSGEKLVCAYAAQAQRMQGMLTQEWANMDLNPLNPDPFKDRGEGRVLWFDSGRSKRTAMRLAQVRQREKEAQGHTGRPRR